MKIVARAGHEDHAIVYILEYPDGRKLECVESVQPPIPRCEKWVLLVSTLFGCPVKCPMCDAGGYYHGKPDKDEIFQQIEMMIQQRFPYGNVPSRQFKIQFARMGEPCLNPAVLDVLQELPERIQAPGLMPSISTVAPVSCRDFLAQLKTIKCKLYPNGQFQFQFSIHSTDIQVRRRAIPINTLSFAEMAQYGHEFYQPGDRKITLNFALADSYPVDPNVLLNHFDPDCFIVKLTPLNPTYSAKKNSLSSWIDPETPHRHNDLVTALNRAGYETIVSIGNVEENLIGSNCGQYLRSHLESEEPLSAGYSYEVTR